MPSQRQRRSHSRRSPRCDRSFAARGWLRVRKHIITFASANRTPPVRGKGCAHLCSTVVLRALFGPFVRTPAVNEGGVPCHHRTVVPSRLAQVSSNRRRRRRSCWNRSPPATLSHEFASKP